MLKYKMIYLVVILLSFVSMNFINAAEPTNNYSDDIRILTYKDLCIKTEEFFKNIINRVNSDLKMQGKNDCDYCFKEDWRKIFDFEGSTKLNISNSLLMSYLEDYLKSELHLDSKNYLHISVLPKTNSNGWNDINCFDCLFIKDEHNVWHTINIEFGLLDKKMDGEVIMPLSFFKELYPKGSLVYIDVINRYVPVEYLNQNILDKAVKFNKIQYQKNRKCIEIGDFDWLDLE